MYLCRGTSEKKNVDDNEKSVFKHDQFLMYFLVFKSYIAIITFYTC